MFDLNKLQEFFGLLFQQTWMRIAVLVLTTGVSFVLGRWFGKHQARRDWRRKEFFNRLNVSLNTFSEDRLQIRTLLERPLEEVFFNAVAMHKVLAAAQRTTEDNPFLPMKSEDCWLLLNFVLNAIAEHYSFGMVRRDAGEPVRAVRYAICLTSEPVAHGRTRKVRAILIRPELLRAFPYPDHPPQLEQPWHDIRVETLRKAAALYQTQPEHFLEVEICV